MFDSGYDFMNVKTIYLSAIIIKLNIHSGDDTILVYVTRALQICVNSMMGKMMIERQNEYLTYLCVRAMSSFVNDLSTFY